MQDPSGGVRDAAHEPSAKRPRSRTSRRRRAVRRRRIAVAVAACLLVCVFVGLGLLWAEHPSPWEGAPDHSVALPADSGGNPRGAGFVGPEQTGTRPVYRYSVIPGGVRTPLELVRVMDTDPVVAAHYVGLNARLMRVEQLKQSLDAHVSYRIGNHVFWTAKTLHLRAGETVLTDGKTTIRARCGNSVSVGAIEPSSDQEPAPEVLDSLSDPPEIVVLPLSDPFRDLGQASLVTDPADPVAAAADPAIDAAPRLEPSDPPAPAVGLARRTSADDGFNGDSGGLAPVPEPTTLVLVGLGAGAGLYRKFRKRRTGQ